MNIKLPWAKREHSHPDPGFWRYGVCSGCGHLILMGHVKNKGVKVTDRFEGFTTIRQKCYAFSCAPPWDTEETAIDGKVRYYKDGKEVQDESI